MRIQFGILERTLSAGAQTLRRCSNGAREPDVPRRPTDIDRDQARTDNPRVTGGIPMRERLRVQGDGDTRARPGFESDFGEPCQLLWRGRLVSGERADVDLRHLRAGARAAVGYCETYSRRLVLDLEAPVLESRVGQSVAEWEEWPESVRVVPAVADVDAFRVTDLVLHSGVLIRAGGGYLIETLRERHRKLSRRVGVAEQNSGDGVTLLLSGVPGLQYDGHGAQPRHRDRLSGHVHDDRARIGSGHLLDKLVLIVWES